MKIDAACLTCFVKMGESQINRYFETKEERIAMMQKIMDNARHFNADMIPLELSPYVFGPIREVLAKDDLYDTEKQETNAKAMEMEDFFFNQIQKSENPVFDAIHLAIIGNIVDYGIQGTSEIDLENFILEFMEKPLYHDERREFMDKLANSKTLVYLTDNSGEIIFDRILLKQIQKAFPELEVVIGAKEKPILNDMTAGELKAMGFDNLGKVMSTGSVLPGNMDDRFTEAFQAVWDRADLVISKGQGNFEGLWESEKSIYFAFMAKCPVLADYIDVPLRSMIFRENHG